MENGRIIALSCSVLATSFPGYGPHIASKAGVEGLIHVLANESRGHKITVNAVAPGPVGTGFEGSVKGQTSLKTVLEEMVRDARKQAA